MNGSAAASAHVVARADRFDYLLSDFCLLLILLGITFIVWKMWSSTDWGPKLRSLVRRSRARTSLAVLALYALVAIVDSVQLPPVGPFPSQSLLDRAYAALPVERTYSAPEAHHTMGERTPRKLEAKHLLGTDGLGKDTFYSTLKGCRTAWIVGGLTLLLTIPVAVLLGVLSGYFGGWIDDLVQYIYITLSSIPSILLLVTLMMVLGKGLWQICVALGVTEWVGLARLLRGETLKHRSREYVLAARAMGVRPFRIVIRHILPNVMHVVIISATLSFSGLVSSEAILSYLGVGVPPSVGSWGLMIDSARMELARDPMVWWNLVGASVGLCGIVLAANVFGDAVRDAFDPKLRGEA